MGRGRFILYPGMGTEENAGSALPLPSHNDVNRGEALSSQSRREQFTPTGSATESESAGVTWVSSI